MPQPNLAHPKLPTDAAGHPRVEGLVLSVMDYKEHDGIIKLAAPDQIYSIYARGIQKETSKNRRLALPGTRITINYDPQYSSNMLYLINGTVEESFWKISQSLEMQSVNALISGLIERHGITPEIYKALKAFWKAAQNGEPNKAVLYACRITIKILELTGTLMDVDECAVCGIQKNIAGISMENGGFVCQDHLNFEAGDQKWDKNRLRQLRWLVYTAYENLEKLESFSWPLDFFIFLMDWYVYANDTPLRALSFLKTLNQPKRSSVGAKP